MTRLHYTLDDAHQWAAFTGDKNPVHFDLAWVRERGGSQLSVHGMRALLDVKRAVYQQVDRQSAGSASYLKCLVRLRRPMWCDADWLLTPEPTKNHVLSAVRVSCPQTRDVCLSCQISPLAGIESPAGGETRQISARTMGELYSRFDAAFPDMPMWQFFDALLFRQLIHDEAVQPQDNIAVQLGGVEMSLSALFAHYPVLQTHQELVFDTRLAWMQKNVQPESFTYWLLPALVVGNIQEGAVVSIAAAARVHDCILTNTVTLKVGPVSH